MDVKHTTHLEIGDWIYCTARFGTKRSFAQIVEISKTRLYAKDDKGDTRAATRKYGKEIGLDTYWQYCPDIDKARAHETKAERQRQQDLTKRHQRQEAKLQLAKDANPNIGAKVQNALLDTKMVQFVDGNGENNAIFFFKRYSNQVNLPDGSFGPGVRLTLSIYGPSNFGDGFASTSQNGATTEEALYIIIATTFHRVK